jgi:GT2 family glycosyltransferase
VISVVVVAGDSGKLERWCLPALTRVVDHSGSIHVLRGQTSLPRAYNAALDDLARDRDVEAAVFMHDDVEVRQPDFTPRVLAAANQRDVAVAGIVGARHVHGLAWWHGEVVGRVDEPRGRVAGRDRTGDVDAVDGMLLIFSRWAIDNLRFDPAIGDFHGYDVDVCTQARASGKRVVVAEIDVFHHTKGGYGERRAWTAAQSRWLAKWPERRAPIVARVRVALRTRFRRGFKQIESR